MANSVSSLPVILISFNRGAYLRQVIASYRKQSTAIRIAIHDNGSDEPETLAVLDELGAEGCAVYRYPRITEADHLNQVDETVQAFVKENESYAVSDSDVDLATADPRSISVYLELLERYPDVECVGPMLTIADIARSYPLFVRAMQRHVEQFWGRSPEWAETTLGRVAVLPAPIDTTLAVHRSGTRFRRLKRGLRVYHPFEARHLDWYVSAAQVSAYNATSSPLISHWDNAQEFVRFGSEKTSAPLRYWIIDGTLGALAVRQFTSDDNPA
jgi:hypothetical protein